MVKRLYTRPILVTLYDRGLAIARKPLYVDLVVRWGSFWIGAHYSPRNQSWCIALIPCVVIRLGRTEYQPDVEAK